MAAAKSQEAAAWEQKMERLRRRSLPERVLQICDDAARRTEYDEAKRAADRSRLLAESDTGSAVFAERAAIAAQRYEAAAEALRAASVYLTFRALHERGRGPRTAGRVVGTRRERLVGGSVGGAARGTY
ncbi:hypothetical protein [Streptomyces vastus]|uniref:Cellulose-binding protein n=1 Tax=Streptomyces vastus TaxID=285451 RepID=A0ABN3RMZ6_9ACTN